MFDVPLASFLGLTPFKIEKRVTSAP